MIAKKIVKLCIILFFTIFSVLIACGTNNYLKKNADKKTVYNRQASYKYYERKLTVKDFEQLDYTTTYKEMVEKLGEPNGSGGEGWVWDYYELEDGCFVICFYFGGGNLKQLSVVTGTELKYVLLPAKLIPKSQEQKKQGVSGVEQFEMNTVLDILGLKEWNRPYTENGQNDIGLGVYAEETLRNYTDENIYVDIQYYFGGYQDEVMQQLIQIIQVYSNDRQVYFGYKVWKKEQIAAEMDYALNEKQEKTIRLSEEILSCDMESEAERFNSKVERYLCGSKELKQRKKSWIELWGINEDGEYMCIFMSSDIKGETSCYYTTVIPDEKKEKYIHLKLIQS